MKDGTLYKIESITYGTYQVNQYDFSRKVETMFETCSRNTTGDGDVAELRQYEI